MGLPSHFQSVCHLIFKVFAIQCAYNRNCETTFFSNTLTEQVFWIRENVKLCIQDMSINKFEFFLHMHSEWPSVCK